MGNIGIEDFDVVENANLPVPTPDRVDSATQCTQAVMAAGCYQGGQLRPCVCFGIIHLSDTCAHIQIRSNPACSAMGSDSEQPSMQCHGFRS